MYKKVGIMQNIFRIILMLGQKKVMTSQDVQFHTPLVNPKRHT